MVICIRGKFEPFVLCMSTAFVIMFSCEKKRCTAYNSDLRWRMIWQKEVLGHNYRSIGRHLNVDPSTVCRIVHCFNITGSVAPNSHPKPSSERMIVSSTVQLIIFTLLLSKPGIYSQEMQENLLSFYGVKIDKSTICHYLKKSGFTRQRLRLVAQAQDTRLRNTFISDVSLYPAQTLVFIDEMDCDKRDTLRKHGYSLRGKPMSKTSLPRGARFTAIADMTCTEMLAVKFFSKSVDTGAFMSFIENDVLAKLMPFIGINPNSVVIMENCAFHHNSRMFKIFSDLGVLPHFLPPYSPDFNPIEEAFSKVKSVLKSMETLAFQGLPLDVAVSAAFAAISSEDCNNFIEHCNIYCTD